MSEGRYYNKQKQVNNSQLHLSSLTWMDS